MTHDPITLSLPVSAYQLGVIATALGIALLTGLIALILSEQGRNRPRDPATVLAAFAWAMVPVWLVTFAATLWQVWQLLTGAPTVLIGPGSLGAGALIAALLGAPFVVWGTVLKQRTVDFQKEGHITDRITSAVEQLGAEKTVKKGGKESTEPNIEVRIGAILSLERIAQDSTRYDKGRDHVRVMEILCAYIRENSRARPPRDPWRKRHEDARQRWDGPPDDFDLAFCTDHGITPTDLSDLTSVAAASREIAAFPKPRADIAQALLVLGRRTADQRRVEAAWPEPPTDQTIWPFDLPCPELREATENAPLSGSEIAAFKTKLVAWRDTLQRYSGYQLDLRGANLQAADLSAKRPDRSDAVFAGALLEHARMEGAVLWNARMEGANLSEARMEGAGLWSARMQGANLWYARMVGANLSSARMEGADLSDARMEGADLSRARMEGAFMWHTGMEGADLSLARMEGANLSDAKFDASTNWRDALLGAASVQSADFTNTPISADQINQTFGDGTTKLPDHIPRPAHWPKAELSRSTFQTELEKYRANPDAYTPPDP